MMKKTTKQILFDIPKIDKRRFYSNTACETINSNSSIKTNVKNNLMNHILLEFEENKKISTIESERLRTVFIHLIPVFSTQYEQYIIV